MFLQSRYFPPEKPLPLELRTFFLRKETLPLKLQKFLRLKILRRKKVRPRTGFPEPCSGMFWVFFGYAP